MPSTGTIKVYVPPCGPDIRVDSGVGAGSEVSIYYDPMLAKLIVKGRTRAEAVQKLDWALHHFVIMGVTTNIPFLQSLIRHPEFLAGRLHTQFLQEQPIGIPTQSIPREAVIMAALAWNRRPVASRTAHANGNDAWADPWGAGNWRSA